MIALFEKLPGILVAAAGILVVAQVVLIVDVIGQYGPTASTISAMIFGLVTQAAQLLALAALVYYARRIAANTGTGA